MKLKQQQQLQIVLTPEAMEDVHLHFQAKIISAFEQIVLNFPPSWFTTSMGSGIAAVVLHKLPYQFQGLDIIAHIVFVFNVLIFTLMVIISVYRYLRWPKVFSLMLNHPSQSLFLGAIPNAMSTIIDYMALALIPYWGDGFAIFSWVLWWINIVLALGITACLLFVQFTRHSNTLETYNALWTLPVVCIIVASAVGSIVAAKIPMQHAKLTIVFSYVTLGIGFSLAVMICTTYYLRLTLHKIPPSATIFSVFLPLGAFGQSAFVVLNLATSARELFKNHGEWIISPNVISTEAAGFFSDAVYAVSVVFSLMLWGFALLWFVLGVFFVIDVLTVSKISFNLGWWGLTFPISVFAIATGELGQALGSGFFRVVATIVTVGEIIIWLMVFTLTLYNMARKRLFISPCLQEAGGVPPSGATITTRKYVL